MTSYLPRIVTRDRLLNLGLVVASTMLVLAGVEAYLLFGMGVSPGVYPEVEVCTAGDDQQIFDQYVFHDDYGWVGVPEGQFVRRETMFEDRDRYTHNRDGFRDTYGTGNESIIVLGDSFTYGWLADDNSTFPHLLDRWTPSTSFINLGQGGYGTAQELIVYRDVAEDVDHDLVILAYVANDPRDNRGIGPRGEVMPRRPRFELVDGTVEQVHLPAHPATPSGDLASSGDESLLDAFRHFAARRSATITYFQPIVYGLLHQSRETEALNPDEREVQYRLELTKALLREVSVEAHRNDADLLIVPIPSRAVTGTRERNTSSYAAGSTAFWNVQKGMLQAVARENNTVRYLDIEPAMERRIAEGDRLYGKRDGHPNERGYRVVAEGIHAWLRQEGYVPLGSAPTDWSGRDEASSCSPRTA